MTDLKTLKALQVQAAAVASGLADLISAETPAEPPAEEPTPDPTPTPEPEPVPQPEPTPEPQLGARLVIPTSAVLVTPATLAAAIAGGAADVVIGAGAHGVLTLNAISPAAQVNIWCDPAAHFERIVMARGTCNLRIIAARVWPVSITVPTSRAIIDADPSTSGIEVFRADVRGHATAADYALWTLDEWKARERTGIMLEGRSSTIRECRGLGLRFAWVIRGEGSKILDNLALGLSEDGARVVGNGADYEESRNYFGDYITTTGGGRHPDAIIQAWSTAPGVKPGGNLPDGTPTMLSDLRIIDNVAVELIEAAGVSGGLPAAHPFRIAPQGIGLHDGSYSALQVRGNRVYTSAWTGMNVNLKRGIGAVLTDNAFYDLQGRKDHAKVTASGGGIVSSGNIAGLQNYGQGQKATPIDYAKAPKPPAPPVWDQWVA